MTTTLREILARRADDAGGPDLDLADLVGLGEARLRRHRLAAAAGGAAAVVIVAAFAVGIALVGTINRSDAPSVNGPSPSVSPSPSPTETVAPHVRQLLYIDVPSKPPHDHGTIHFGDRVINSGNAFVHTDVTDDGFVYTSRGDVWFSDGGDPQQIGSRLCGALDGVRRMLTGEVQTGAGGSLVAWFACANPSSPTLVVYDTGSGREVVHQPMPACGFVPGTEPVCGVDDIIGEHIYFSTHQRKYSYDVTTGTQSPATARSFADDVRSNPRGLVYGDTWESATVADIRGWDAVGTRLVAIGGDEAKEYPTSAFDTATHQAVHLRLPPGYHPNGARFAIFEWLDDDTVALTPEHNLESADIITCRLSEGLCHLAVKSGPPETIRFAPTQGLPG